MEDLKEVERLIILQVDHNRECGKDDKFTKDEIADIINRRVVKNLTIPVVSNLLFCGICEEENEHRTLPDGSLECEGCGNIAKL